MPPPDVIGDVSETLRTVLSAGLSTLGPPPPPAAIISDLLISIPLTPAVLTVFLYEVVEDPSARNRSHSRQVNAPNIEIIKPPMALLLRYMLTPWSPDRRTDQQILARVLQTLYDDSILSGPQLVGPSLQNTTEALKVTLVPMPVHDRAQLWQALEKPYRISLTYEVRVINLDSGVRDQVRPVSRRDLDSVLPEDVP